MTTNEQTAPAFAGPVERRVRPVANAVTARELARQVFALCEWFEDLPDGAMDSQEVERFKAGQRFAAKRIRNAIGTWLTDEEGARKQPAKVPRVSSAAELKQQAKSDMSCVGAFARARPGKA